jgi:hypothetical protein
MKIVPEKQLAQLQDLAPLPWSYSKGDIHPMGGGVVDANSHFVAGHFNPERAIVFEYMVEAANAYPHLLKEKQELFESLQDLLQYVSHIPPEQIAQLIGKPNEWPHIRAAIKNARTALNNQALQ